ncbi:MAG: DUF3800 domain-containing protein [Candidatus Margulisbacteria bacterium]|jgi:hypothetical protein|nr:DUF3800 domain-containing protein [Candidatus Margulisiibacteriota bacterium]
MKYSLYIDESGDHVLKIDQNYPIFILCGVLLSKAEHDQKLTKLLNDLKIKHFGRTSVILHTIDFLRPRDKNSVYYPFCDADKRNNFFRDLENLIKSVDFKIMAIAVSKPDHLAHYKEIAPDTYLLSVKPLADSACTAYQELGLNEPIDFIAESRNKELDKQLLANYLFLESSASKISRLVKFCKPVKKEENISGLQLADLVVTPIGRFLLHKKPYLDFSVIKNKVQLTKIPATWQILEKQLEPTK